VRAAGGWAIVRRRMHEHRDTPPISVDASAAPVGRAAAGEALGSFLVVFVGAGSVVVAGSSGSGLVGVALASGFAFAAALAATTRLSGGGVNPVLTAALWVTGRLPGRRALAYAGAQLVGGIAAGSLLRLAVPEAMWRPAALGAPLLARDVGAGRGTLLEAVLSLLLTVTALGVLDRRSATPNGSVGAAIVGLFVAAATLAAWPLTGAALNPARALGPELAAGAWTDWWVYWIGPLAGGVVGAVASWWLFAPEPSAGRSEPSAP
jgi:aquaporin TIP